MRDTKTRSSELKARLSAIDQEYRKARRADWEKEKLQKAIRERKVGLLVLW